MKKFSIIIGVVFPSVFAFFFSNIKGYYRFKQYCEAEGGLRVYEPLERNVGWLADDYNDAHVAAQLKYTGFVRYTDKEDGKAYDLKYLDGDPQHEKSVYKFKFLNEEVFNESRLGKYGYEIHDLRNGEISVQYYMFGYSKFNRNNTLLGSPSGSSCFDEVGRGDEPSLWHKKLDSAFKN